MNQNKTTGKDFFALGVALALLLSISLGTSCNLLKKKSSDDETLEWFASVFAGSRFKDNGNGTVTDSDTGRTWMKCAVGQVHTSLGNCQGTGGGTTFGARSMAFCEFVDGNTITECVNFDPLYPIATSGPAFAACSAESAGGHTDWRLPTREELTLLAGGLDRATFIVTFPESPDDKYFWSGSGKGSSDGTDAYGVSFAANTWGESYLYHKANSNLYVRCVR